MGRLAVDVVLLPDDAMADRAIEVNAELVEKFGNKIALNRENCLPHISLAMGCVSRADITAIENILKAIVQESTVRNLKVSGISAGVNAKGEKVSAFDVEKTKELQQLHTTVMEELSPYLTSDATEDMIYGGGAAESTLLWIKNYRVKSGFANFSPHITIGYGEIDDLTKFSFPIKFAVSKLALCHLANHCTCRKVLVSTKLKMR
jgi:2'-5' RNA ligase